MATPKGYEELVEGFREKIRGNVSSTKLTESECTKEIEAVLDGAISTFVTEETHPALTGTISDEEVNIGKPVVIKRKRGRPKGSRNRPKEAK